MQRVVGARDIPRAAVLLIVNSQLAVVRRDQDCGHYYLFPGGQLDPDETYEEAARREILEELGIRVDIGLQIGERVVPGNPQRYFVASLDSAEVVDSDEQEVMELVVSNTASTYDPVVWLPIRELASYDVRPNSLLALFSTGSLRLPTEPFAVVD